MNRNRIIALAYAGILLAVAALNYIPGLTDASGRTFGIFALDLYDDLLHLASAIWAGVSGLLSRRAATTFLQVFGSLYLLDGLLGVFAGSGFLDLGILVYGVLDQPLLFNVLSSLPHLLLGGVAVAAGFRPVRAA